jgi:ribose transport system ATP-binding protein
MRLPSPKVSLRAVGPLASIVLLMVVAGVYVSTKSSSFLSSYNINSLLIAAVPLALVSMGQANALLVGGFDVSVGAVITICVVVASFTMRTGLAWYVLLLGGLALIAIGLGVGFVNAALVRVVRLPSIIATLATLSILQGIALALRPIPGGEIDQGVVKFFNSGIGTVPYAFIGVVILALVGDWWLYRTRSGLVARAVGLNEESAHRLGMPASRVNWRAFILASLLAAFAAYFVAAQVGVGDPTVGSTYTLQSIAAAVLGGASLTGGRGSFVGALIGALLLSLIINALPFLGWGSDIGQISIGTLTLLALVLYRRKALWRSVRDSALGSRLAALRPAANN